MGLLQSGPFLSSYLPLSYPSIHSDQNLHHSSAARLAALLLRNHRTGAADPTRIGGLLTNHAKIIARGDDDEVLQMVKEEGAAMRVSPGNLEEALMCLVLTNAVEVLDEKGTNVGIAVYDWNFSWINHSCSPNACYRFTAMADDDRDDDSWLRIYPAMVDGGGAAATSDRKRIEGFGPRIIVRSIKGIRKDEEVTIAYTDLLQPKVLTPLRALGDRKWLIFSWIYGSKKACMIKDAFAQSQRPLFD